MVLPVRNRYQVRHSQKMLDRHGQTLGPTQRHVMRAIRGPSFIFVHPLFIMPVAEATVAA